MCLRTTVTIRPFSLCPPVFTTQSPLPSRCQELVVSGFAKLLGSQKDENWPLPTMYTVCLDLRLLALKVS